MRIVIVTIEDNDTNVENFGQSNWDGESTGDRCIVDELSHSMGIFQILRLTIEVSIESTMSFDMRLLSRRLQMSMN